MAVEDVGVDHGGGDIAVTQELLDSADVVAGFEEVGAKLWRRLLQVAGFVSWAR